MNTYYQNNKHIKWKYDLIKDITVNSQVHVDQDSAIYSGPLIAKEISDCNLDAFRKLFSSRVKSTDAILEIGVNRIEKDGGSTKEGESFSSIMLELKRKKTKYFGIDVFDKTYFNDITNNVHIIHNDSSNYNTNVSVLKSHGVEIIDLLFIDGWHSIMQVTRDWEYTNLLSDHGVVVFHDTNYHPGPRDFCAALNREMWNVDYHCTNNDDWGIAFVTKKL
jgi:hypothetical protein